MVPFINSSVVPSFSGSTFVVVYYCLQGHTQENVIEGTTIEVWGEGEGVRREERRRGRTLSALLCRMYG